ncbi:WD40 repeat-like protein [Suillus brevipes Sb2]|nr:WD40 repeat-like protein [Suillus brevipes Sb2]
MSSQIHEDEDVSSLGDVFTESSSTTPTTHDPLFKGSALFKGHRSEVMDATFIPGTRLLVTCSTDKSIRVWDFDTEKQVGEPLLGHDHGVCAVAASSNGRWIVSGAKNGSILVWEIATKKTLPVSFKGHEGSVWSIVFAPNGESFASASNDLTVCVWKRETGEIALGGPLKVDNAAFSVSYSPDGTKLAAGTETHIIIWSAETGEKLLKIEQRAWRVAFTPDGLRLVSGNFKDIRISDATTGDIIKRFDAHTTNSFFSLAIAPNGTKFATTSYDKTMRFFDLTTFELIGEPLEHPGAALGVAFSEDSQLIATGCFDNHVRTWTVPLSESERELQQLETISDLQSPDDGLPPRFCDVDANFSLCPSNHGVPQRSTPRSRIMGLVNHLSFRRQSQQAHPSAVRLHHLNKVAQFLQQHLAFRRSLPSLGQQPVINVAAGRGTERVISVSVPEGP